MRDVRCWKTYSERHRTIEARLEGWPAVPDPLDAAQERAEERVWIAVVERSHEMQAKVKEALERLAAGRYHVYLSSSCFLFVFFAHWPSVDHYPSFIPDSQSS